MNHDKSNCDMADEELADSINYTKIIKNLKSTVWYQKSESFESLLKYLIDLPSSDIQFLYEREQSAYSQIVQLLLNILQHEQVYKVLEAAMDFLEFLISSLPEAIFSHIYDVCYSLLCLL